MKLLSLLLLLLSSTSVYGTEIKIVTEHYPPFQYVEDHEAIGGVAVEIVQELLKETGVTAQIEGFPWARAYQMALNEPNVLIFSITRNKERESLFKWVGPLIGFKDYFWSLKERKDIKIKSLEDAKRYTIAVPRSDNQYQFLKSKEFSNLVITSDYDTALKMLYGERVDLIVGVEIPLFFRLTELNLDYLKVNKQFDIGQQWGDLCIAFSKDTPDDLVKKFQKALKKLKQNGKFEDIFNKWLPDQS